MRKVISYLFCSLPLVFTRLSIPFIFILFIQGCADSGVTRGAQGQADQAYLGAQNAINNMGQGSAADAYQNSSQATKGVVLGGAAGAIAGSMSSGIGTLPGLAGGAIFGGAIGAYMDAHTTLADQLQNRGVQVIELGDYRRLIIPSAVIFNEKTATLRAYAYSTLDLVATYVGRNPNMSVKVAAYTSDVGSTRANVALTKEQANNIVKYLWAHGIDTRLLYAVGYGGTDLVTANTSDWTSDNYRVEVSLEKLPV